MDHVKKIFVQCAPQIHDYTECLNTKTPEECSKLSEDVTKCSGTVDIDK